MNTLSASTDRQSRLTRAAFASSASDEWATPAEFFGVVEREIGGFDLDPCCVPSSAKAPRFFTLADDGLAQPWAGRVWLNPPYSKIGDWMAKAHATAAAGAGLVVCLVPARTDTRWFWRYALPGEVLLLPGQRVPFAVEGRFVRVPSCLVILRPGLPWFFAGVRAWDWRNDPARLALLTGNVSSEKAGAIQLPIFGGW